MPPHDTAVTHRCRYRLVTGCTVTLGTQPGRAAHEKTAHADILTVLRDCPECGDGLADEAGRGMHLANVHGLAASSERRQELDALQVKAILGGEGDPAADAAPLSAPSLNGHAVAPADLESARDALSSLIAEVQALRAENAALKAEAATFAQIRSMLIVSEG